MRRLLFALAALASACAGLAPDAPRLTPLPSPTRTSLRGVSAVTADVAWISGSGGTCLRTLDGGHTWIGCPIPGAGGRDLRDVHAFDAHTAVVLAVGEPALVWRTDDGGATWSRVFEDARAGAFLDGMDFADDQRGWLVGDPVGGAFVLARSLDGGRTWEPVEAPAPLPGEAAFAASGTSVVCLPGDGVLVGTGGGPAPRILRRTRDHFTVHLPPLAAGTASRGVFSLAHRDGLVIAVGGDYRDPARREGTAAFSSDGGRTFTAARVPPRGYRSGVALTPSGTAIAVGENGADVSCDGGATWHPLADTGYHAIALTRDGGGFAVGAQGRIARLRWE